MSEQNVTLRPFVTPPSNNKYVTPHIAQIIRLAERDITRVQNITIPGDLEDNGESVCLWEMGGGNGSDSGLAMLVSGPNASFVARPFRFVNNPKPNGRHAMVTVWKGCNFTVAGFSQGKVTILVYEIINFSEMEAYPMNAIVHAHLVGYYRETWNKTEREYSNEYHDLVTATMHKIRYADCKKALYANPWGSIKLYGNRNAKIFDKFAADAIPQEFVARCDNIAECLDQAENLASKIKEDKTFTPVRQIFMKDPDSDRIVMYMVVIAPPKFDHKGNLLNEDAGVEGVFVTDVTAEMDIPTNASAFARCASIDDLSAMLENEKNGIKDIWLRYTGC